VRHGETDWNAERRLQGHLDVPLNETGHVQAAAAASHLGDKHFTAIYCSDLSRARQTATAIGATSSLSPITDPDLRERHYGAFQGLTYEEARAQHPVAYARFLARDASFAFGGGGESLTTFALRVRAALERIVTQHPAQQVLVVTHGGVLDIAHRLASGTDLESPRNFTIPNAALNWLEFDGARWHLLAWADQTHLAESRDELPNA
jgi:probable phosphoglycerate mutase